MEEGCEASLAGLPWYSSVHSKPAINERYNLPVLAVPREDMLKEVA